MKVVSICLAATVLGTAAVSFRIPSKEESVPQQWSLSLPSLQATVHSAASVIFAVADCPKPNPDGTDRYHEGLDSLLSCMDQHGLSLYKTFQPSPFGGPDGIISPDDIVLIKINYQWDERGGTNTDVLKGLMRRILEHPDGFTGEVVVVENIQVQPEGKQITDFQFTAGSNAECISQSPRAVIEELKADGYDGHVSGSFWANFRNTHAGVDNHTTNGYVPLGGFVAYPKFTTENGNRIDLRYGLWNGTSYENRVKFINVPVLKDHSLFGVTAASKNYMGVPSVNFTTFNHGLLNLSGYLGRLMVHVRYPDLNIIDAIYINAFGSGPGTPYEMATNVNILLASTDPVALDYYAGKYVLFPVSGQVDHNPDEPRIFREYMQSTIDTLRSYGFQPAFGDSALNAHVTNPFGFPNLTFSNFQVNDPTGNNNGELNSGETADIVVALENHYFGAGATGIIGTVSSTDQEIMLINNIANFSDISLKGLSDNSTDPFVLGINPGCSPHWAEMTLLVQADGGFSDTITFSIPVGDPVLLLVDDDGGQDLERYYEDALKRNCYIYSYRNSSQIHAAKSASNPFTGYETIVWFTGACEESTLTEDDQSSLADFLDNGGTLFLSGQNIGSDLAGHGCGTDFYANYLHADFLSDASEETFLYKVDGDPISGEFTFFTLAVSQTSPSIIAPRQGATPVLVYQNSLDAAAIKYEGKYKVVNFAFGFEGIRAVGGNDEDIRAPLLNNIIRWFNYVPIDGDVTQDGLINVLDVLAVINHILGIQELQGIALGCADCNSDGSINVLDALGIVNVILGIVPECSGNGTSKPMITRETMEFLRTLQPHLSSASYAAFMALVTHVQIPHEYSLEQNYPNPFNPTTTIGYTLPGGERRMEDGGWIPPLHVSLKIFNILGQEVQTLVDESQEPGYYTATWDGRDYQGREVASGIYFYRLASGDFIRTMKMMLMK